MAPLHVQLANCAAWHTQQSEKQARLGNHSKAERHDIIAFILFRKAHDLKKSDNPKGPD